MKRHLLLLLVLLLPMLASAYDACINGIYYNFSGDEAEVTFQQYIGYNYVSDYSGTVVIPENVRYTGKTYSVTSIGYYAFDGCSSLTSILIPNSVTTIGNYAFSDCTSLTSITIPNSVTRIGWSAFSGCSSLTSVTIPNSVTSIEESAFYECSSLTSIIIPNSVTSIDKNVFGKCSSLTSVTIPNSVTNIGGSAFSQCINLTYILHDNNDDTPDPSDDEGTEPLNGNFEKWVSDSEPLGWKSASTASNATLSQSTDAHGGSYACKVAAPGDAIKRLATHEMTLNAGTYTFSFYAKSTTGDVCQSRAGYVPIKEDGTVGTYKYGDYVNINNDEWTLISYEFTLTATTKLCLLVMNPKNSSYSISQDILVDDATLTAIPTSTNNFGKYMPKSQNFLTNATIPESVTSIGQYAFYNCSSLTSVTIPESVTSIGNNTFERCNNIEFHVTKGSYAMFYVWNHKKDPYESETNIKLSRPILSALSTTQTTITYGIANMYPEYEYEVEHESVGENAYLITGLRPSYTQNVPLRVYYEDNSYSTSANLTTSPISPSVTSNNITASSIIVEGCYIEGDANVVSQSLTINGNVVEGKAYKLSGLNPNTSYNFTCQVVVEDDNGNEYSYEGSGNIRTAALSLVTQQPKVINVGNVIVAAQSNLDDEETNVGFEWRRIDWTNVFASNTGVAYLYDGTLEGYIRNLYYMEQTLWKYRPYYESNAGNRYYGDWVGIDPTNTSYFEPTVHTYAQITVTGNRAEVKGYAMRGTDNVTSQGFYYWPTSVASARRKVNSVPADAIKVLASGNVMTATLEDLEYETQYCYVAFVTTSEGETFYGESQIFSTSVDPDGINDVKATEEVTEVARYDLQGRKIAKPQKGINIIRYSDGTSRKVLIK